MPGVVMAVVSLVVLAMAAVGAAVVVARRDRAVPVPRSRPLEDIVADVRRISAHYHQEGMRFAKYEGCRRSYDQVLAEAADTLEISHLVGVLEPGAELDHERERLERRLAEIGLLPHPA